MKRREFIAIVGCAVSWPLIARAQQSGKIPTVAYLWQTVPFSQQPFLLERRGGDDIVYKGWVRMQTRSLRDRSRTSAHGQLPLP
jgi:hypothetical protein